MDLTEKLNIPTIVTVIVFAMGGVSAFSSVKETQSVNAQAIAILVKEDIRHDTQIKELKSDAAGTMADLRTDIKELRTSMGEIKESLAILRGRAKQTTNQ